MNRVLVIDAHGDDALLGMGGTIALHSKHLGDQVQCLVLTDGGSTQYPGRQEVLRVRQQQGQAAHELLGIKEYFQMALPDMRLRQVSHVEINGIIEQHIRQFRPQIVYCVHPDGNLDHQCVFESTLVACRPVPGASVRRVITYAPLSSTEWDLSAARPPFQPNLFVDIGATFEDKLAAMRMLATELRDYPHPRSLEGIRAFAAREGSRIGVFYAEPLQLMREVFPVAPLAAAAPA